MMQTKPNSNNPWRKRILIGGLFVVMAVAGVIWYIFTEKFADTTTEKPTYTLKATDLIAEFESNDSLANKKFAEQIIVVNGIVAEKEAVDSTINIKMTDSTTGSYIIFAFQQQHAADANRINVGEQVSIKGSCSGGAYSKILDAHFVTFKRAAINL